MQIKVTAEGVLIPKDWLGLSEMVEVRREGDLISIIPLPVSLSKTFQEIQAVLLGLRVTLQQDYQVTRLGIFGSFARQEQRSDSDVDILIDYVKAPSLIKVVALRDFLAEQLGMKVDIVTVNGLKDDIKSHVLEEVIYLWTVEG
jgi:uncharacterized protein